MKIGIVTVTFNSSSVLDDFFTSIEQQDYPEFNLYLIDNNSIDDTLLKVESWSFKSKVILKNTNNLGVAAGNNQGIKLALKDGCDFVLLLNNDTVFEDKLLSKLVETYNSYGSSIVVPKINYFSPSNMIWYAGGFYNRKKAFLNFRIEEQDSGEITEYQVFSSIKTRSPTPIPKAPPEAPSPIITVMIGTFNLVISKIFLAIASP